MKKVTLKDVCWVALINIGVLALAVYAWISYDHRQKIFNSEEPIQNYSVLIAGRIAAFADRSEEAKAIYKEIMKAMNECSIKKRMFLYLQKHCLY